MSELKPCPFCGKDKLLQKSTDSYEQVFVSCLKCYPGEDVELSIWNTRPIEDALTAQVARLTEAGDRMANMDGFCCNPHNRWLELMTDTDSHTPDCPVAEWQKAKLPQPPELEE